MNTTVLRIDNMDCPTEERIIRNRLRGAEGIGGLEFDLVQRRLTVRHSLADPAPLVAALRSVGMDAAVLGEGEADREPARPDRGAARRAWAVLAVAGAAALASEAAAWATGDERAPLAVGLAVAAMALGGRDTLRKGWAAVRTMTLNINFLMTVAVAGAVVIGQWPEAATVTVLFALAEATEGYAMERARHAIRALMAMTPDTAAVRAADGGWAVVPAASVAVGQRVRVRPGERIPLDGTVVAGRSSVDQAAITGESVPVDKGAGDAVFAGTVNQHGTLELDVTAAQRDTTLARIVRSVQAAQAKRAPTQNLVDAFARVYTPAVVLVAIGMAAVPPLLLGAPPLASLYDALVLLVIACPCALVISTPVTVVSGLAAAARRGILVKGGTYLERGHALRAVALDKTGTLTKGALRVTDVVALGDEAPEALLRIAASLESPSEHAVAAAIAAHHPGGDLLPVEAFQALPGRGVRARVAGRPYVLGNHRLAEEEGVCGPEVEAHLERLEREGKTAVVLASDRAALAVLGVADAPRPSSVDAVRELAAMGMHLVMLTGDNETTARAIGREVGIADVRANLLPDDKVAAVAELVARHGSAGMVGDGVNDAPALATATIGFAMGAAGTDVALETADVALMHDDLRRLPAFLRLSRRTSAVLRQNIAIALGLKAVFFALAFAGQATLWAAVLADLGGSLLVVANGLRLLRGGDDRRDRRAGPGARRPMPAG